MIALKKKIDLYDWILNFKNKKASLIQDGVTYHFKGGVLFAKENRVYLITDNMTEIGEVIK